MTVENISWSISTIECYWTLRGSNSQPPDHQSDVLLTEPRDGIKKNPLIFTKLLSGNKNTDGWEMKIQTDGWLTWNRNTSPVSCGGVYKSLLILTSFSMKPSTAGPAFTSNMTRLGFFRLAVISSRDLAPITLVPFASFCMKSSTFETVLLNATT